MRRKIEASWRRMISPGTLPEKFSPESSNFGPRECSPFADEPLSAQEKIELIALRRTKMELQDFMKAKGLLMDQPGKGVKRRAHPIGLVSESNSLRNRTSKRPRLLGKRLEDTCIASRTRSKVVSIKGGMLQTLEKVSLLVSNKTNVEQKMVDVYSKRGIVQSGEPELYGVGTSASASREPTKLSQNVALKMFAECPRRSLRLRSKPSGESLSEMHATGGTERMNSSANLDYKMDDPLEGIASRTRSSHNLLLLDGKIFSQKKETISKNFGNVIPTNLSDSMNLNIVGNEESEVNSGSVAKKSSTIHGIDVELEIPIKEKGYKNNEEQRRMHQPLGEAWLTRMKDRLAIAINVVILFKDCIIQNGYDIPVIWGDVDRSDLDTIFGLHGRPEIIVMRNLGNALNCIKQLGNFIRHRDIPPPVMIGDDGKAVEGLKDEVEIARLIDRTYFDVKMKKKAVSAAKRQLEIMQKFAASLDHDKRFQVKEYRDIPEKFRYKEDKELHDLVCQTTLLRAHLINVGIKFPSTAEMTTSVGMGPKDDISEEEYRQGIRYQMERVANQIELLSEFIIENGLRVPEFTDYAEGSVQDPFRHLSITCDGTRDLGRAIHGCTQLINVIREAGLEPPLKAPD